MKKERKQKTKESGITLIVLVVTVVIMIILAGVVIMMMYGPNGLIQQGKNSGELAERESIKYAIVEEIRIAENNSRDGFVTAAEIEEILLKYGNTIIRDSNGNPIGVITDKGYEIMIDDIWTLGNSRDNTVPIIQDKYVIANCANERSTVNGTTPFLTDDGVERQYIKSIKFNTTGLVPASYDISWDVSEAKDGSIIAYGVGDQAIKYDIVIVADDLIYLPPDSSKMFRACRGNSIDLTGVSTIFVVNMSDMFSGTWATDLKLGDNFDTSSVTDMSYMFRDASVQKLDLGDKFDTSRVQTMMSMFRYMDSLEQLNLRDKFDTSNVTDMSWMFYNCDALIGLDLGDKFNTSKVEHMFAMFEYCEALTYLNLGNKFDTSSTKTMHGMFGNCKSLTSLDLGNKFDTSKVITMDQMFDNCRSLTSLDLGDKFVTKRVGTEYWNAYNNGVKQMFSQCVALETVFLGYAFSDTTGITDTGNMFTNCGSSNSKFYVKTTNAQNWMLNLPTTARRSTNWNTSYILLY